MGVSIIILFLFFFILFLIFFQKRGSVIDFALSGKPGNNVKTDTVDDMEENQLHHAP